MKRRRPQDQFARPSSGFAMQRPRRMQVQRPGGLVRVDEWKFDQGLYANVEWQRAAFGFYRTIGQIRKTENTKANTLAACRLRLKLKVGTDEFVDPDPADPAAQAAARVFDAWVGPYGGNRELMRKFALLADTAGEAFMLGIPHGRGSNGDSPDLTWEFVSRQEIRGDRPEYMNNKKGLMRDETGYLSLTARPVPPDAFIARWHNPDPQFSSEPDSPMRSVIPDAEEYVQLRAVVTGAIRQRMANGILLVPESASFGTFSDTYEQEGDDDDESDPLLVDLERHMGAPIRDRAHPSAYVPLIFFGDPADLKEVRMVDLSGDNRNIDWATPLREEKLRMISESLDAPPETMTGRGDINHFNIYSIDHELATKWVIPRGQELAEFVTAEYLRSMLVLYEGFTEEQASVWEIRFDSSNIEARADRGVTAIRLYDRRLLSGTATVTANNFQLDDMPSAEEVSYRVLVDMVLRRPELLAVTSVAEALGLAELGVDVDELAERLLAGKDPDLGQVDGPRLRLPDDIADPRNSPDIGGDSESSDMEPVVQDDPQVPSTPSAQSPERGMAAIDRLVRDLTLVADGAADVGLKRATSRIVSFAKRRGTSEEMRARVSDTPSDRLLMVLSDDDLESLGTTSEALTEDMWTGFKSRATVFVSRFLSTDGAPPHLVPDLTASVVDELVSRLQAQVLDARGDRRFDGLLVDERLVREIVELEVGNVCG